MLSTYRNCKNLDWMIRLGQRWHPILGPQAYTLRILSLSQISESRPAKNVRVVSSSAIYAPCTKPLIKGDFSWGLVPFCSWPLLQDFGWVQRLSVLSLEILTSLLLLFKASMWLVRYLSNWSRWDCFWKSTCNLPRH